MLELGGTGSTPKGDVKSNTTRTLLKIFVSTAKIGALTFGGGYAMVPVIEEEFTTRRKFVDKDEFSELLVVAQSLPGPIAVNTSALVGYKVLKLPGAVMAACGAILFPFLTILAIATVLKQHSDVLEPFLKGARMPVFAVLCFFIVRSWKAAVRDFEDLALTLVSLFLVVVLKMNPVLVLLTAFGYATMRTVISHSKDDGGDVS